MTDREKIKKLTELAENLARQHLITFNQLCVEMNWDGNGDLCYKAAINKIKEIIRGYKND